MSRMTELTTDKPVLRRTGKLVIKLDPRGISIRGRRRRRWLRVPWDDLAKLAARLDPPAKPGWTERQWADVLRTIGAK